MAGIYVTDDDYIRPYDRLLFQIDELRAALERCDCFRRAFEQEVKLFVDNCVKENEKQYPLPILRKPIDFSLHSKQFVVAAKEELRTRGFHLIEKHGDVFMEQQK